MSRSLPFASLCALSLSFLAAVPFAARAEDKPAEKVTYMDHVLPLFRAKCGTCHSADQAKGGLVLDSYGAVMQGGASGAVVEAGSIDDSRLWELITHKAQPAMPPKEPKLPDEMLLVVQKWIVGGALENMQSQAKVVKKKQFSLTPTDVSSDKPEGAPAFPENLPTEPLTFSARGNAVTALAISPWAPLAAVAGYRQVLLYNLQDFTIAGVLPFPEGTINVLRFSRNGSVLLVAGGRGGQSGKAVVFDVKTGSRVSEVGAESDAILAADISPNLSQVAVGGSKRLVRVYSTTDGELQFEMKKHTDWVTALEFSPDGVLLASGDRSNGLVVWESSTGREFYTLTGHTNMVTALSWRIDSNVLASSSEDTTIRLWEMNNGTQVKTWGAHGGGTAFVNFLRDGRLITTGRDNVAKLWDQNGTMIRQFSGFADLGMRVAYSESTAAVVSGDWTGTLKAFDVNDARELAVLLTNPPAIAVRLDQATKASAAADGTAAQVAAQVAALQKVIADKKAAAEAAAKAAADGQTAATAAVAAKDAADKLVPVKAEAQKAAETAATVANVALEKAKADKDAAEKAADKKDVPAATAALQAAEKAAADAKAALEKAVAEKAAADKGVVDTTAAVKTTADQAVALKAASDKAAAEAIPTPDMQKALADLTASSTNYAAIAAVKKAIVVKLTAEQARAAAK